VRGAGAGRGRARGLGGRDGGRGGRLGRDGGRRRALGRGRSRAASATAAVDSRAGDGVAGEGGCRRMLGDTKHHGAKCVHVLWMLIRIPGSVAL
jgi:hypothetical protein